MPNRTFAAFNPQFEKYVTGKHPAVKARQRIEIHIAHALLTAAIAQGFTVRVSQGDADMEPMRSTVDEAMADLFACDDDRMYVFRDGKRVGWVYLVYGNDGWDVISDYTTNLESLMEGEVQRLQEFYG